MDSIVKPVSFSGASQGHQDVMLGELVGGQLESKRALGLNDMFLNYVLLFIFSSELVDYSLPLIEAQLCLGT